MTAIDVLAPLRAIYDQWTRFEDFPGFVTGLAQLRRDGATRLRGRTREGAAFTGAVTEQHLDERIAWRTLEGPFHEGVVTLRPLGDVVRVELELTGLGDAAEVLDRFKALVESRSPGTGEHVDIVHPGATRGPGDDASVRRGG